MERLHPQWLTPGGVCSQTCAVATSPTPPSGQPIRTVSTVSAAGPPVHAPGRVTRGAKVMVSGKASGALPGSLAPSPQGDRPLGCHMAAVRGGRGHRDAAAIWEAAGLGEQLQRCGKQQAPGCTALACQAAAILCPGLAKLCGWGGAGGGHGPPGQGSSLGHRGVLGWAVLVQDSLERGSVPGVSSSSSWACHWE